jgi:hypothetical protein
MSIKNMNKGMKFLALGILGMFLFSFSLSFVSAAPDFVGGAQDVVEGAYELIKPVLESVIGDTDTSEFFLAKVVFLLVILAVVWKSMEKVPFFSDNDWVLWIVSLGVSILAIRWFGNAEIVKTVILPYSALGIAISAALPFIGAFFIIRGLKPTMRRVGWIFFGVVFLFLWFTRYEELGNFGYIYLVTVALAILMMIFDGTIQKTWMKASAERSRAYANRRLLDVQRDAIKDADDRYARGDIERPEHEKRVKEARKKMANLAKTT